MIKKDLGLQIFQVGRVGQGKQYASGHKGGKIQLVPSE